MQELWQQPSPAASSSAGVDGIAHGVDGAVAHHLPQRQQPHRAASSWAGVDGTAPGVDGMVAHQQPQQQQPLQVMRGTMCLNIPTHFSTGNSVSATAEANARPASCMMPSPFASMWCS